MVFDQGREFAGCEMITLGSILDDTYTDKCWQCCGTGKIYPGREVGKMARKHRERAGMTLGKTARAMGIPVSYLSDLERGNTSWHAGLVARFDLAIDGESLRGSNTTQGET